MTDRINFTSRITPLPVSDFYRVARRIGSDKSVNFPWTVSTSMYGTEAYTTGVIDCTSCLIANENAALLMHLTPSVQSNHNFQYILKYISLMLDLNNKSLHAVLMGSKNTKKSINIYNNFVQMLRNLKIPISEFRNGKKPSHIAYSVSEDNIYVSNAIIGNSLKRGEPPEKALYSGFEQVIIGGNDLI